jgi:hypothetical protein
MVYPTAAARLVAPAGSALSLKPGVPRTAAGTINLAAVAAAADEYLRLAASAQEQPGRPFRRLRQAAVWTPSATGGIMPRHACSAPCGARRRTRAWQFRSTPCLPIGRLSSRHCALDTRRRAANERAAQEGLWICGQRKRVAHIPTGAANDDSTKLIALKGATAHTLSVIRRRLPAEEVRSVRPDNCAIFARIRAAIHNLCSCNERKANRDGTSG